MSAQVVVPVRKRLTTAERSVAVSSHVVLSIWAIIVILPLLWTLMTSFKTTSEIFKSPFNLPAKAQFVNYTEAWNTAGIGKFFFNTIFVVGSALVLVMLLGSMCAYILARFDFPGNRLIYYMLSLIHI